MFLTFNANQCTPAAKLALPKLSKSEQQEVRQAYQNLIKMLGTCMRSAKPGEGVQAITNNEYNLEYWMYFFESIHTSPDAKQIEVYLALIDGLSKGWQWGPVSAIRVKVDEDTQEELRGDLDSTMVILHSLRHSKKKLLEQDLWADGRRVELLDDFWKTCSPDEQKALLEAPMLNQVLWPQHSDWCLVGDPLLLESPRPEALHLPGWFNKSALQHIQHREPLSKALTSHAVEWSMATSIEHLPISHWAESNPYAYMGLHDWRLKAMDRWRVQKLPKKEDEAFEEILRFSQMGWSGLQKWLKQSKIGDPGSPWAAVIQSLGLQPLERLVAWEAERNKLQVTKESSSTKKKTTSAQAGVPTVISERPQHWLALHSPAALEKWKARREGRLLVETVKGSMGQGKSPEAQERQAKRWIQAWNDVWARVLVDVKQVPPPNKEELAQAFFLSHWWHVQRYPGSTINPHIWNAWRSLFSPQEWLSLEKKAEREWKKQTQSDLPEKAIRAQTVMEQSIEHLSLDLEWVKQAKWPSERPVSVQEYYWMQTLLSSNDPKTGYGIQSWAASHGWRLERPDLFAEKFYEDEDGKNEVIIEEHAQARFQELSQVLEHLQQVRPLSPEDIKRIDFSLNAMIPMLEKADLTLKDWGVRVKQEFMQTYLNTAFNPPEESRKSTQAKKVRL